MGQKLQAHHLTQVQEFCLFFILFFCLKGKLSLRVRRPILPSVFFFQKRKVINSIATPPWMGCLSITQLPSFFPPPPPPKRKIAFTNLFYRGGERQSERVKYPAHQLNPVTQPWFEPRPVPRESR